MRWLNPLGRLFLAAACLLASFTAWGETLPPQLQAAQKAGVKVVTHFPAASGLTGWVTEHAGHYQLVFSTSDGKTLIVDGVLVDASGRNLTATYAEKYIPKPDYAPLFARLARSRYVVAGQVHNPRAIVYVFFDPNCIFCHYTWQALKPYEKVGLQVRWVPVAFLKPTSLGRAAAILEAKNGEAALDQDETRFNMSAEEGGLTPAAKPAPASVAAIQANGQLMAAFGSQGTPTLVWRDRKSGKVKVLGGMPRLSQIPEITGLPEQPMTDPDLARFK
ncbi:MAG: thiol:disulfide interchange protein DsbG [Betaproteobacteria bacterium]|nr:thiol:disulfide interchange protein DsbG [Betaproteobacteria bacterium]